MSRAATVWVVFGALVVATALAPTAALAQRGGGGGRGMAVGGGRIISAPTTITGPGPIQVGPTSSPQFARGSLGGRGQFQGHHHNRIGHHHRSGFVGSGPTVWYGYGGVPYYYPYYPAYYPQAYYDQGPTYVYVQPSYSTEMVPTPMQRVVEFPTGRYELRGDGYGTPYHWIWIPNPPSAPPAPAPPALEPAPPAPPASTRPEPPRKTTVYRWTDADGVTHFTDRPDSVPAQHRPPARSGRAS